MKNSDKPTCGDFGGTRTNGKSCKRVAGWGTPDDAEGRCRLHRGTSPDGESHDGNQHAVSHSLYAQVNNFYQNGMDDAQQDLCDDVFEGYLDLYTERNGSPPAGFEARLFEIAVNHIKIINSDNWLADKPTDLESGNPMVDKETHYSDDGDEYYEYNASVVISTQQRLRSEDRQWLKSFGLTPDADDATEAMGTLAGAIKNIAGE